jgi:hypothetical protein
VEGHFHELGNFRRTVRPTPMALSERLQWLILLAKFEAIVDKEMSAPATPK